MPPLLLIAGLIALLNLYTRLRLQSGRRVSDHELFVHMLLDVAGLTGIFYFTGGAANPFVWFYLLPLMIAATILPRTLTWIMAAVTVLCYSGLYLVEAPAATGHAQHGSSGDFRMHVFGMWLGFVMSAGFVAVIIVDMAYNLRERDRRLAAVREEALRNERLAALGTLATGAAHELGTPLGTMAILTAELEAEYTDAAHAQLRDRLGIIHQQIRRCKEALAVLSGSAGAERAEAGRRLPVPEYLRLLVQEWREQRPDVVFEQHCDAQSAPHAEILAERTLTQALINILNNAADASPQAVRLDAGWTPGRLTLEIADRGAGIDHDIRGLLGKRPVSTKAEGLGVGLYLAHATLQRLGGKITLRKRAGGGSVTRVSLPLLARPAAAS
jgi:two-component system sensor histidine kinase RegB